MSVNLDGLSVDADDYFAFWNTHQNGRGAAVLFPDRPPGYRRATADLANYASNKGTAMRCREKGDIETALAYEAICDRIYAGLPEFARW